MNAPLNSHSLPAADADAAAQAQQQWHQERLRALTAPDNWLTLVDLIWLEDGTHTVGAGADCTIRLPGAGRCPDHWGTLQVTGKTAMWTDASGQARALQADSGGTPTLVQQGPVSFHLLERNDALAMRVKDQQAETRVGFQGTELFPFDPAWQITAQWDGALAHCEIGGQHYTLRPQKPDANPLHFVIGDATTGTLSYGGGRFLYVPLTPAGPGPILLDLNRCINPPCAFTRFALCPVPPPENRLIAAVVAGEKTYNGLQGTH
ncbi:MAG: DUF1684 domain-containing protein [Rhodoferax sp.]|jgi:uncharacterized protein (DUF1684 family)|nr:DUF1684 domain-containing protein [Rhodoferax sp.]